MKPSTSESWRDRYIRILSDPKAITDAQDDLQAMHDLIEAEYFHGTADIGPTGVVSAVFTPGVPTLKGRLFCEEQKAILRSRTFFGRIKSSLLLFSAFIIAFIAWGLGLLTPLIQQRLQDRVGTQNQQQNNTTGRANLTQQATAKAKNASPHVAPIVPNQPNP